MFSAILIILLCITGVIAGIGLLGYGLYLFGEKGMPKIRRIREHRLREKAESMPFERLLETALYSRYVLAKAALSQIDELDALETIGQSAKEKRIRIEAKGRACACFGHDWHGKDCLCRRCGQRHDYEWVEYKEAYRKYRCRHCDDIYEEELTACSSCYGEGEILYFASESGMGGGISQTCPVCGGVESYSLK